MLERTNVLVKKFRQKFENNLVPDFEMVERLDRNPTGCSTIGNKEKKNGELNIVTVILENIKGVCPNNNKRLDFLRNIVQEHSTSDIILFPAGYFDFNRQKSIMSVCEEIRDYLMFIKYNGVVCIGMDCDDGNDQLAVAISKNGLEALGRKFYPTSGEKKQIRTAESYDSLEMGYPRTFCVKGQKIYLAVCYDVFGIRLCKLPDLGVNIVLALAHQFWDRGEGASGDVDFARKGFGGASQYWKCPVFGSAVFFHRSVPVNWPTGVLWTNQNKSVRNFKYTENEMGWLVRRKYVGKYEAAVTYRYSLEVTNANY